MAMRRRNSNGIVYETARDAPGVVKMWAAPTLPDLITWGRWVWADGASYVTATYPRAAANIDPAWRTAHGAADPGAGNFRVPDLRGLAPIGVDAMPGGARANRVTRAAAAAQGGRTGEEYHTISVAEMPSHGHAGSYLPDHAHSLYDPGHRHNFWACNGGDNEAPPKPNSWCAIGVAGTQSRTFGPMRQTEWFGIAQNDLYHMMPDANATGMGVYGSGNLGVTVPATGGGGTHENLPPSTFVPYIVRLD